MNKPTTPLKGLINDSTVDHSSACTDPADRLSRLYMVDDARVTDPGMLVNLHLARARWRWDKQCEKRSAGLEDTAPMNSLTTTLTVTDRRRNRSQIEAAPCPFCGSTRLRVTWWSSDDGEYDAIECNDCLGCAPADKWNQRSPVAEIQQIVREVTES